MQFAEDPALTKQLEELGLPPLKQFNESVTEVTFDKHKEKLLIKEMRQQISSGSPGAGAPFFNMALTPVYTFQFKEFSGFLLPTVKDMSLPGRQLSGMMADQEWHFIVEYLDYKITRKSFFRPETGKDVLWIESDKFGAAEDVAVNLQPNTLPKETLDQIARDWAAGWWQNLITERVTYTYSGSGGNVTFTTQYPANHFPLMDVTTNTNFADAAAHFKGEGSPNAMHLSYTYRPELPVPVKPDTSMKKARAERYPKDTWIDNAVITGFKRVSEYLVWNYMTNTATGEFRWFHWWKYKVTVNITFNNDLTVKDGGVNETTLEDKGDGVGPVKHPASSPPLAKDYVKDPQRYGWKYHIIVTKK